MSSEPAAKRARVEQPASITILCAADARVILPLELATQCTVLANLIEDTAGQGDAEVPAKNMSAVAVQALAALLRGEAIPEDFTVVGDAIMAANFFDAAVVLDALLKHVLETAKAAAARLAAVPSPNPYALMLGLEDSGSLTVQLRNLNQRIRAVEPALAERITREVYGGDAVDWSSPAAAYTTVPGDARLKTAAAKMAGGEIELAIDGTAETVNGLEVGRLASVSEIEKCSFDHGAFSGKIVSIVSFESVTSEERPVLREHTGSWYKFGLPRFRAITLQAICSLTTAAGAATCDVTFKAGLPEPDWRVDFPDGVADGVDGLLDYFEYHSDHTITPGKSPADFPFLELTVKLNDGQLSEEEQSALQAPGDFKDAFRAAFYAACGYRTPGLWGLDGMLVADGSTGHVGLQSTVERLTEKQFPLFAALWRPVLASLWMQTGRPGRRNAACPPFGDV